MAQRSYAQQVLWEIFSGAIIHPYDPPHTENPRLQSKIWEWEFPLNDHSYLLRFILTSQGDLSIEFERDHSQIQPQNRSTDQMIQDTRELFTVLRIVVQHTMSIVHQYQSVLKTLRFHALRAEENRVQLYDRFALQLQRMFPGSKIIFPSSLKSVYKEYIILL